MNPFTPSIGGIAVDAALALPACAAPMDDPEIVNGLTCKLDNPLDTVAGAKMAGDEADDIIAAWNAKTVSE